MIIALIAMIASHTMAFHRCSLCRGARIEIIVIIAVDGFAMTRMAGTHQGCSDTAILSSSVSS
jgi:disulfide bond formation protein DsbB